MRKTKFSAQGGSASGRQNEYYYHICNRGVDKREVFCDGKDYLRFLRSMREFNKVSTIESLYRHDQLKRKAQKEAELLRFVPNRRSSASSSPLVEIICYCLNPNHFHLLLQQVTECGVSKFMQKLSTSYTKYFNAKNNRSGSLFQGPYKSVPIKTDAQLLYVSAYINGNPEIHKISKGVNKISKADKWQYSSCFDYLGKRKGNLCSKKVIQDQFRNIKEYKDYIKSVVKNSRDIKKEIKNCLIE